jgi:spore coat polysaccharide biosynthesis protein SpsF (cytidylyltransferase family)
LERIIQNLSDNEAEHLTKRFYDRPEDFRLRQMSSPFPHLGTARLVVDTPEDLARFRKVAEALGSRVAQAPYQEVAELYLSCAKLSMISGAAASPQGRP